MECGELNHVPRFPDASVGQSWEKHDMAIVLIVEDEIFIREIATVYIEESGHETHCAANLAEAHSIMRSPQHFDVLFTDIRLNSDIHGGYEVALEAVKNRPNMRVIYTSGTRLDPAMSAMLVENAHFLQKPYSQHQLHESIETILAMTS